jgi:PadR family transcriptional regulator PadR
MIIKSNNVSRRPAPRHQDVVFGSAIFRGPVKTKTIVPLLILHLLGKGPEHGYGLMRRLEERGFVVGTWEHPDRRSRRLYRLTRAGAERYEQIKVRVRPHLDRLIGAMQLLRSEVVDAPATKGVKRRARTSPISEIAS